MKKHLSLIVAICIALSSFAAPWDIMPRKHIEAPAFTDPYVTYYYGEIVGTFNAPNYALKLTVQFNQSVPAPYYALIQVFGLWGGSSGGSYREFTILLNSGQWTKSVTYPMHSYEEAYVGVMDLLDYGPQ
jgi:hypothetical protein